jgi:hypothetical protein
MYVTAERGRNFTRRRRESNTKRKKFCLKIPSIVNVEGWLDGCGKQFLLMKLNGGGDGNMRRNKCEGTNADQRKAADGSLAHTIYINIKIKIVRMIIITHGRN